MGCDSVQALVAQLDSFDAAVRRRALERLVEAIGPEGLGGRRPEVNLHCHTSLSYNAYGYSPTRFAWEARRYGLEVAGIVDFDVLDGVREFLEAGRLLKLKTVAGFETRVFVEALRDKVTNSPNEPGVSYLITTGFAEPPPPGSAAARTLTAMAERARRRNREMVARLNRHLEPVTLDYERDVLPLTPAGNATERHMLVALERRAREVFPRPDRLVAFWSGKLNEPEAQVRRLLGDPVAFRSLVRLRLMKHGGVAYARPEEGSFPALEEVVGMTRDCGALPSGGWLDGTNDGEEDPAVLFRFWLSRGIPTVTIIPDRNWNLKDSREKAAKVANLREAVSAASELEMPILVGTEMNADGQKLVDTFDAPELASYGRAFLDGAHFAWGHTLLKMTAGVGAVGPWAEEHFGGDRAACNEFFRGVGSLPYPDEATMDRLAEAGGGAPPEAFLSILEA
jgi:hypothetical protein